MDRGLLFLQWILGSLPSGISLLRHNCYTSACILSSKTNNFGKDSHLKLPVWLEWWSMRNRRELNTGLSTWQTNVETTRLSGTRQLGDHSAIRYSTTTPLISFWLICTTRRWDRGSVCGQTLFLSELNFFLVSMRKPIFLGAGDQASIPGVNRVLFVKKIECFLFANKISLRNAPFFSIV